MSNIDNMNEENLISAIKSCYKYPNCRVLVYTTNMVIPLVTAIINYLYRLSRYDKEHYGTENDFKAKRDMIEFENGSSIRVIKHYNIINAPRGYRVHKILIDGDVNSNIIENVLTPYIREYTEPENFYNFFLKTLDK